MITLNMIYHVLDGHILTEITSQRQECFSAFHILEESKPLPVDDNLLYLIISDKFNSLLERFIQCGECLTILVAEAKTVPALSTELGGLNIIVTPLSLTDLCNHLVAAEHAYDQWRWDMENDLRVTPDLSTILRHGEAVLKADGYLLDLGWRIMAFTRYANCPLLGDIERSKKLSKTLLAQLDVGKWTSIQGWELSLCAIQVDAKMTGYLLTALPIGKRTPFMEDLHTALIEYLTRFIHTYHQEKYISINQLTVLMSDLIEGRLSSQEELRVRVRQVPIKLYNYFHLVVIEPDQLNAEISPQLAEALVRVFPDAVIVPYRENLLVLSQTSKYTPELSYDKKALAVLLERYQAVACVGNYTKWLTALRPIYIQTKGCIPFARLFREDSSCRIFRYEEFSMYQLVDLCAQHCQSYFHDDLLYLCHPGVIKLGKYDDKHHTDYCKLLKSYLMSDRNVSLTSKTFYMHRNTLQNRLAKISQLVGEDLENSHVRQRLLFSLMVVEYMRTYLKSTDIYGYKRYLPSTSKLVSD